MRNPGESPDELRFGFVIVDSKKRGKGYGKAMLQLGLQYAYEVYGARKVSLGVFENNETAYHCYESVGFKDVVLDEVETYHVLGEAWKCRELEFESIILETERLVLRRYFKSDLQDLYEYLSDEEVVKFEPYRAMNRRETENNLAWRIPSDEMIAVELKADKKMIGNVHHWK